MAFRLIFESDGNEIHLIRKIRIDMIVPASPTDTAAPISGVYAELRNEQDETLYQIDISSQVNPNVEIFAPDAPIQRVEAPEQKRIVVLVVPDPPDARSLVVVRHVEDAVIAQKGLHPQTITTKNELLRVPLIDEDMVK